MSAVPPAKVASVASLVTRNTASLVDLLATVKELAQGAFCQMDCVILVQVGFLSWCAEKLKLVAYAEDSEGFVRAANEDVVLGVKCCSGRIVCNCAHGKWRW